MRARGRWGPVRLWDRAGSPSWAGWRSRKVCGVRVGQDARKQGRCCPRMERPEKWRPGGERGPSGAWPLDTGGAALPGRGPVAGGQWCDQKELGLRASAQIHGQYGPSPSQGAQNHSNTRGQVTGSALRPHLTQGRVPLFWADSPPSRPGSPH